MSFLRVIQKRPCSFYLVFLACFLWGRQVCKTSDHFGITRLERIHRGALVSGPAQLPTDSLFYGWTTCIFIFCLVEPSDDWNPRWHLIITYNLMRNPKLELLSQALPSPKIWELSLNLHCLIYSRTNPSASSTDSVFKIYTNYNHFLLPSIASGLIPAAIIFCIVSCYSSFLPLIPTKTCSPSGS